MLQVIDALQAKLPGLSLMEATLLVAAHQGLAHDTRSFAREMGLAHALVLRDCVALASEHGLLSLEDRGERSQRLFFNLTPAAQVLFAEAA